MPIINGKRFFEYVDFYIQQREKLFDLDKEDLIKAEIPEFVEFYEKNCLRYSGSSRSGDEKVRNMYENILFAFIDKFGFIDDFGSYYEAFYKTVYFIRCNYKRITTETILKCDERKIFRIINDAVTPDVLKSFQYKSYRITGDLVKGIDNIKTFIENGK